MPQKGPRVVHSPSAHLLAAILIVIISLTIRDADGLGLRSSYSTSYSTSSSPRLHQPAFNVTSRCGEGSSERECYNLLKLLDSIKTSITRIPSSIKMPNEEPFTETRPSEAVTTMGAEPVYVHQTTTTTTTTTAASRTPPATSTTIRAAIPSTTTASAVEEAESVVTSVESPSLPDPTTSADSLQTSDADEEQNTRRKELVLKAERVKWSAKGNRYRKLPIRPPKLKLIGGLNETKSEFTKKANKITYAAYAKSKKRLQTLMAASSGNVDGGERLTPSAQPASGLTSPGTTLVAVTREDGNATDNSINQPLASISRRNDEPDLFDLSSSETKPSAVHQTASGDSNGNSMMPSRLPVTMRKFYSGRVRRHNSTGSVDAAKTIIPKLLLPKFIRPRMYSLDGFIPKPNVKRLPPVTTTSTTTTTTAPPATHAPYWTRRGYSKKSFQGLDESATLTSSRRRKFGTRGAHRATSLQDVSSSEYEDLSASGSSSRRHVSSFSKRKGFVSSPSSQQSTSSKTHRSSSPATKRTTGVPGADFPTFHSIPKTSFECSETRKSGVFADLEAGCQVWHMCQGIRKHSFLCPNGTIFSEKAGVCDWWYNVNCSQSPEGLKDSLALPSLQSTSVAKKPSKSYAHLIDFEELLLRRG